eukprot:699077-Pleurochrysis_carterae.AAC.2
MHDVRQVCSAWQNDGRVLNASKATTRPEQMPIPLWRRHWYLFRCNLGSGCERQSFRSIANGLAS